MRPEKEALRNLKQTRQQKQQPGERRMLKVAIVVKPDGDWTAIGGNGPENDRLSKALWGAPDGSHAVWALVEVELPAGFGKSASVNPSRTTSQDHVDVSSALPGNFVGPGDLPIIDLPT